MPLIIMPRENEEHEIVWYWCFTIDTDQTKAIKKYTERFGEAPQKVFIEKGLLWLGPVSTQEYPNVSRLKGGKQ